MNRIRILHVEDETVIALEMKTSLENLGYEVIASVKSGDEAIRTAKMERPDLVLMDVQLKGDLDGIDAAKTIRDQTGIPVVFITAYDDEIKIERAKTVNPFGYILKPVHERNLCITIDMALHIDRLDKEKNKAQSALSMSEEKLRNIFCSTPNAIVILDEEGRIIDCNPELLHITDHTEKAELVGQSVYQSIIPEERSNAAENMKEVLKGDTVKDAKCTILSKSGNRNHLEISANSIRNDEGDNSTLVITAKDVTLRHRARKRIKQLNQLNEALLGWGVLEEKLKTVTDAVIRIFKADLCRIWLIRPGDLCESGCVHATEQDSVHRCSNRESCLHLVASSGRYSHLDGDHGRIHMGGYLVGRVASGDQSTFVVNDIKANRYIHNQEWADELGLESFAGYRLLSGEQKPIGVMALFSRHSISQDTESFLLGLANNVSQVIQSETAVEKVRDSEKKFRFLAENMDDIVWTLDMDLKTSYVSPSIEKILGFTPAQRKEQQIDEMLTPDSFQRSMVSFEQELKQEQEPGTDPDRSIVIETEYIHVKGHTVWMENSLKAIRDERGNMVGIYGCSRSIDGRKRAEQALADSEELFRSTFNAMNEGLIVTDAELNPIYVNPKMLELTGYTKTDLEFVNTGQFFTKASWDALMKSYHANFASGKPTSMEVQIVNKDGSVMDFLFSGNFVLKDGKVHKAVAIFTDINEIKASEAEREKMILELEEALDSVKTLSGLLPICAHCKKIRDDSGYWKKIETYIEENSEASFSHSICMDCAELLYKNTKWYQKRNKNS